MTPDELAAIRDRAEKATPGPWEHGDRYHVQSADMCECRERYGPLILEQDMDINGEVMPSHVHRRDKPWWEHGIMTMTPEGPANVVVETDEYGLMRHADAEFIAAARTDIPALVAEVERLTEVADIWHKRWQQLMCEHEKDQAVIWAVRDLHSPIELKGKPDPYCRHCLTAPGPWPCHTARALGETP